MPREPVRTRIDPVCGQEALHDRVYTLDDALAGPPASFALKRAEVRDLLAGMADVDPALAALGPPGFLGRVSVWTKDAPLFAVRAAVLDAASLTERTEEDRRVLKPDFMWSFGPQTLPHDLAAVIAAEQVYRAFSILNNLPYHRGR